jgi:hypothetical protein
MKKLEMIAADVRKSAHNYVFQLLEKGLLIGIKHYYLILLCELNHHPRVTAERLLLRFVESSDVVDCVREEVSHVQQQFSFDCDYEVVDKFKHVPDSFLMGSDGSFFGVGHVFPCFISDQQRNLSLTIALIFVIGNPHLFHIETHADIDLLSNHLKETIFDPFDLRNSLVLFVLYV